MKSGDFVSKAREYVKRLRGVQEFDTLREIWQQTNIPYDLSDKDPFSLSYKKEVLRLYEDLTDKPYDTQNELTSTLQTIPIDFDRGFPWATGNLDVISAELAKITQAFRALQDAGMNGKRIIEFGAGWGNLAIPLAKSGQHVTVVDIDRGFLARIARIAERENVEIAAIEDDFISACGLVEEKFDAVIFQSSFHHCIDFYTLLHLLKDRVLTKEGKIFFFSEPVFENYQFPWGIRFDGESLWAVMCNKWLELGFDQSFFSSALLNAGFFLERISEIENFVGYAWRASPTNQVIDFGKWILPSDYAATFHLPETGASNGRFCKRLSRLPALVSLFRHTYHLYFVNYAPMELSIALSCGGFSQQLTISSNDSVEIAVLSAGKDLLLSSATFYPNECIAGNGDTRELGVFLSRAAVK